MLLFNSHVGIQSREQVLLAQLMMMSNISLSLRALKVTSSDVMTESFELCKWNLSTLVSEKVLQVLLSMSFLIFSTLSMKKFANLLHNLSGVSNVGNILLLLFNKTPRVLKVLLELQSWRIDLKYSSFLQLLLFSTRFKVLLFSTITSLRLLSIRSRCSNHLNLRFLHIRGSFSKYWNKIC